MGGTEAAARPCYYLVGATGYPNLGDELVARTWLRYLARVAPDADVWLDCHSPGPAQVLLGGEHPRLRFTDTLWRLCWHAPADDPRWVQQVVRDPRLAPRWVAGVDLLARADVVHLLGGGYLAGLWPQHLGLIAGATAAARRSGGRAVMTGQGLVPAATGAAELVRSLAAELNVVDVRDGQSADPLAPAVDVERSCDDVFLDLPRRQPDGSEPRYLVCVQSDAATVTVDRLADTLLTSLRAWQVDPRDLGIVEGIPGTDRAVFAVVEDELPGARFYPFNEVWRDGLPVAPHQTWLSSRFHVHLLAAAAGARGVALSVHSDYYRPKHQSLIELGSGWRLADGDDPSGAAAGPPTGGFPAATLAALRATKQRVAERIYQRRPATAAPGAAAPECSPAGV